MAVESQPGRPVLLLPGASATGRDFLLQAMMEHTETVGDRVGLERPIVFMVAQKTTDRPSRGASDLTKECITAEEFALHNKQGEIIAPYILESNNHYYGYRPKAFDAGEDVDVVVADASVYQIPHMREHLGDRAYVAAMLATRDYRHQNLTARGSESPEEVKTRLDLGDAHVALLLLMHNQPEISLGDFIDPGLAENIDTLIAQAKAGEDTSETEAWISNFSNSEAVPTMVKELVNNPEQHVDELIILGDEHRISEGDELTDTEFFNVGVQVVSKALQGAAQSIR